MHSSTRIKITELNPHLICVLCGGYYIDAATIIECLHSFCRTCISRYLDSSKYCPICDVMVHKTRPLQNVKSDKTLQDLVYKLVPGLYKNEMKRRRDFYADQPQTSDQCTNSSSEERGNEDQDRLIYTYDEKISVSLELYSECMIDEPLDPDTGQDSSPGKLKRRDVRFLLCPAAFTVGHLKKFIRMKFDLPLQYKIDVFHSEEPLDDVFTLMDIAYIYTWRRISPLRLIYTIYEVPLTKRKRLVDLEEPVGDKRPRIGEEEKASKPPSEVDEEAPKISASNVSSVNENVNSAMTVPNIADKDKAVDKNTQSAVNERVQEISSSSELNINSTQPLPAKPPAKLTDKQKPQQKSDKPPVPCNRMTESIVSKTAKSSNISEQERDCDNMDAQNTNQSGGKRAVSNTNVSDTSFASNKKPNGVVNKEVIQTTNGSVNCNNSVYDFEDSRDTDTPLNLGNGFRDFSNKTKAPTLLNIPNGKFLSTEPSILHSQFTGKGQKMKLNKKPLKNNKPAKETQKGVKRPYNKTKHIESPPKRLNLLTGKAVKETPIKTYSKSKKDSSLKSVLESLSKAKIKDSPNKDVFESTGKVKSSKFNGIYTQHVFNGHFS